MLINREEDVELDFLLRPWKASDIPDLPKISPLIFQPPFNQSLRRNNPLLSDPSL